MPNHDVTNLVALTASLARAIEDSERLSLPVLNLKLSQAQRSYPEDYTIGMMSRVLSKMANSDKLFISRSEICDLYEKFYATNNKFASLFGEEMGRQPESQAEIAAAPVESEVGDLMEQARAIMVDPVLASALDKAFGGSSVKPYNVKLGSQAVLECERAVQALGLKADCQLVAERDGVMLCSAGFETPRGTTSVFIPVQTDGTKVLYSPGVFIGNQGSDDLTKANLVSYIVSRAGEKLTVNAGEVLEAALVATGSDREVSDVDLALIKLNSQAETAERPIFDAPSILGVKIEELNPNLVVEVPTLEDPEISSIASTFDTARGLAAFKFGKDLVLGGSQLIGQGLRQAGIDNFTVAVDNCNDDTITYSVGVNGGSVAFKVPLKVETNKLFPPSYLLCNGSVKSFDAESLKGLLVSEGFDRAASLSASPLYGVKPSELVRIVRQAMVEGNYAKAEDAINVLSDSEDTKAYQIALQTFAKGLGEPVSAAESGNVVKCSMVVDSQNSQHQLCGHTGLPLHKVYQDKNGHCLPKYRENMDVSYDGASFVHSKVLFQ